jgi:hypothetical protein
MTTESEPETVPAVAIVAPLACTMETASLTDRPRVALLTKASPEEIAKNVVASGARWVWVEGFSGAGKSNFALRLGHHLGWHHVALDGLAVEDPPDPSSTRYADYLDRQKLEHFFGSREARTHVVVEGICLREVLARFRDFADVFVIYIARVSKPTPDVLVWHDGHEMETPHANLPWLSLATIRYHGEFAPYADADRILLRVEE